jgi:biopolymer transport protein ExbD
MMQFPRKTRIFRGEFQAGPFAAVFLLFLIFFAFNTSLVYLPGLPMRLDESQGTPLQTAEVNLQADGSFHFRDSACADFESFEKRLRAEVQTNAALRLLVVQAEPAAKPEATRQVASLAKDLKLRTDLPGGRLDLPVSDSLVLVTNPVLVVAVNLSGEVYFQSQVVPMEHLRARLAAAIRDPKHPPTLVVLADKHVEYNVVAQVGSAARAAGIQEVSLAARPPLFPAARP